MNEELKPCPFCGGKAELVRTQNFLYHIKCKKCRATVGEIKKPPSDFRTKLEVIEAWNTRAERTCNTEERTTTRHGKFKTKYGNRVPICEWCGYSIGDKRYNFCPHCGARVVG